MYRTVYSTLAPTFGDWGEAEPAAAAARLLGGVAAPGRLWEPDAVE